MYYLLANSYRVTIFSKYLSGENRSIFLWCMVESRFPLIEAILSSPDDYPFVLVFWRYKLDIFWTLENIALTNSVFLYCIRSIFFFCPLRGCEMSDSHNKKWFCSSSLIISCVFIIITLWKIKKKLTQDIFIHYFMCNRRGLPVCPTRAK